MNKPCHRCNFHCLPSQKKKDIISVVTSGFENCDNDGNSEHDPVDEGSVVINVIGHEVLNFSVFAFFQSFKEFQRDTPEGDLVSRFNGVKFCWFNFISVDQDSTIRVQILNLPTASLVDKSCVSTREGAIFCGKWFTPT